MGVSYKDLFVFMNEDTEVTDLLCTTMSLDIDEQLRIIGCLHNEDRIIVGHEQSELLKSDINRCYFFYDERKSNIHPSDKWNSADVFTALHAMQYPVRLDKADAVFHPKIVLLRFMEAGKIGYRLQISSRNITSTNSFEVAVQLEGRSIENANKNHNVDELLCWFSDNLEYLTKTQKDHLTMLAKELKEYRFELTLLENSEVEVTVSGIASRRQDEKLVGIWQAEQGPAEKGPAEKKLYILSPDYETDKKQIEDYHRVYAPVRSSKQEGFETKLSWMPTHAKLYFYLKDKKVWLGSCNSSEAALLGKNVECMVSIESDRIQEYISVSETDNSITVFGEKCLRVTQGKAWESDPELELASILASFLRQVRQSGSDQKATRRNVKVRFEAKDPLKVFEAMDIQKYILECLPVGFLDEKSNGGTKWQKISLAKSMFFTGSRKDTPNGLLRVRLTKLPEGEKIISSERIIVIDENARKNAISQIESLDSSFFIQHKWLEEAMKLDDKEDVENEYHLFSENLKIVRKLPLSDEQQEYLNGLELVMKAYIASRKIDC